MYTYVSLDEQAVEYSISVTDGQSKHWLLNSYYVLNVARYLNSFIVEDFVYVQKEIFHVSWDQWLIVQIFGAWSSDNVKSSSNKIIF